MWTRDEKTDSCSSGREHSTNRRVAAATGAASNMSLLFRFVALAVVLLSSTGPVSGQFTVQPLKLDFQVTSGKLLPQKIDIRNTDDESHTIELRKVDLTQNIDGDWEIVEPNSGVDTSKLASLKDSIQLGTTSMTLGPLQTAPVEVVIRVPRGSRGFACAGIIVSMESTTPSNTPINLEYLVPVVLQVMSRSVRHDVRSVDLGMEFIPAGEQGLGSPATTVLWMDIVNDGRTFPRCKPLARIWSWAGGHWRHVTTTAFQDKSNDVGIIPGAKVRVKTDLMKTLPAGQYKIAGELYVDGRRIRRLDKEMDFAGDPEQDNLAVDVALDLDQREVMIEGLPGSTRTTSILVQNASDEVLNIQAVLELPRELTGKVIQQKVNGSDMDCTPWIDIEPKRFKLQGAGWTQPIRITCTMPESAVNCPNYYANLDFWSFYSDGQNAGRTRARVAVQNIKFDRFKAEPVATAGKFSPHPIGGSKYLIAAEFHNNGLVHFTPIRGKAAITDTASDVPRVSTPLKSDLSVRGLHMLPAETRNFSGVLDLSLLDPGEYRLSVGLQYDENLPWAERQFSVKITTEGGRRVLDITGTQEDLNEVLEVKWSKTLERAIENNERG